MTDEQLTAPNIVSLGNLHLSRRKASLLINQINAYGDQRAAEELKKFQGLICTCKNDPCGSGICISSPTLMTLAEARKAALENVNEILQEIAILHCHRPHIVGVIHSAIDEIRQLADSPAPEKTTLWMPIS